MNVDTCHSVFPNTASSCHIHLPTPTNPPPPPPPLFPAAPAPFTKAPPPPAPARPPATAVTPSVGASAASAAACTTGSGANGDSVIESSVNADAADGMCTFLGFNCFNFSSSSGPPASSSCFRSSSLSSTAAAAAALLGWEPVWRLAVGRVGRRAGLSVRRVQASSRDMSDTPSPMEWWMLHRGRRGKAGSGIGERRAEEWWVGRGSYRHEQHLVARVVDAANGQEKKGGNGWEGGGQGERKKRGHG
ncbi:unnamed protein product [Closterium sp. NIES-53]